jgi:hypothetical protein
MTNRDAGPPKPPDLQKLVAELAASTRSLRKHGRDGIARMRNGGGRVPRITDRLV